MKNSASFKVFVLSTRNKSWFLTIVFLTSYFLFIQSQQKVNRNFYDFHIETTEFFSLSYVVIPAYIIILTTYYSTGNIQNHLVIRCSNRFEWYKLNLKIIALITTVFIFIMIAIPLLIATFGWGFSHQWSEYALDSYAYFGVFLQHVSPLFYVFSTFMLIWLFLFSLGMVVYIFYLAFKRLFISIIIILLLNITNIGMTLSRIDWLDRIFWTKRVSIFEYIYLTDANQHIFPFQIFLYWLFVIVTVFGIGYLIVHRTDFDFSRGRSNDIH